MITGVIGFGLFVIGVRAFCYSQLTYVTASMLANSLPKTDLRIVQIGGGIKELYYYPSSTVQVWVPPCVISRKALRLRFDTCELICTRKLHDGVHGYG